MADKVLITRSKLDTLANKINTKAGTTGSKTIDQMGETVDKIINGYIIPARTYYGVDRPTTSKELNADITFTNAFSSATYKAIHVQANVIGYELQSGGGGIQAFVGGAWNENYRTITVTTAANVSTEFGAWFFANYTMETGYTEGDDLAYG